MSLTMPMLPFETDTVTATVLMVATVLLIAISALLQFNTH